ncbi:agamous-like MADS-box protein AGL80 [Ipomoea triloba]|uniref:agamous-like MADS-box protein AGL80 n=1 Tax=Ipomoea triloba TaxID=35885 RepID=UPI00125E454A|nr:agamous-like MADS-box protein AGL80 [Ipomoea triloba]
MARRRLRLAYIVNESKRKTSYQKRKRGLLKKINELTILCDAVVAMIMYSSFEQGPVIWPPTVERFEELIVRFLNLPDEQQTRRMMNNESLNRGRIEKLSTQLLNLKNKNRKREMNELMHQILTGEQSIDSLNFTDLNDIGWVLNTNLADVGVRFRELVRDSSPTLAPFLSATASPSVLWPGTSNVVSPADVFSGQSYQGMVGMQTPMSPNLNPGMASNYQNWSFMNSSVQNDPTQGGPGPSTSKNP